MIDRGKPQNLGNGILLTTQGSRLEVFAGEGVNTRVVFSYLVDFLTIFAGRDCSIYLSTTDGYIKLEMNAGERWLLRKLFRSTIGLFNSQLQGARR